MNTELIPDIIEDNLVSLYKTFALIGNYAVVQHPSYTWIKTAKSVFPHHVFQIDPGMKEESLLELIAFIRDDQAPAFLIIQNEIIPGSLIEGLKTNGFRQIMQWPGMAMELNKNFSHVPDLHNGIVVKKIADTGDINDWARMVELSLFNQGRLDRNTLKALALNNDFGLYTGFLNGMAVGTLLSYTNKQIAGFYMITTLPLYRKKGIARHLINTALNDAVTGGCRYAVLESTLPGLSLYRKAGFIEYCNFDIYWMLGKNSRYE